MTTTKALKVSSFLPSRSAFQFANTFKGLPLPDVLEKLIDTSKSVHGMCGGMCFAAIDFARAGKSPPPLTDAPAEGTRLYQYLWERQLASWGVLSTQVLRYVFWMSLSDQQAQAESRSEWAQVRRRLRRGELTVLGLVYVDLRESLAVWDNHQVLAYGSTEQSNGAIHIHVYDPNFPRRDDIYLEAKPVKVDKKTRGLTTVQVIGPKRKPVHGFFVVPYEYTPPPDDLG
jgi:hypothetical protein